MLRGQRILLFPWLEIDQRFQGVDAQNGRAPECSSKITSFLEALIGKYV